MGIRGLTAYAHVADVQRSVDFYARLGLEVANRYEARSDGKLVWAFVASTEDLPNREAARLMLRWRTNASTRARRLSCSTAGRRT